jgi:hypothetical protein
MQDSETQDGKAQSRTGNVQEAFEVIKQEIQAGTQSGSFAHAWHCNIAMSFYDACPDNISSDEAHRIGNEAASRFMKMCFDVETKN